MNYKIRIFNNYMKKQYSNNRLRNHSEVIMNKSDSVIHNINYNKASNVLVNLNSIIKNQKKFIPENSPLNNENTESNIKNCVKLHRLSKKLQNDISFYKLSNIRNNNNFYNFSKAYFSALTGIDITSKNLVDEPASKVNYRFNIIIKFILIESFQ